MNNTPKYRPEIKGERQEAHIYQITYNDRGKEICKRLRCIVPGAIGKEVAAIKEEFDGILNN